MYIYIYIYIYNKYSDSKYVSIYIADVFLTLLRCKEK